MVSKRRGTITLLCVVVLLIISATTITMYHLSSMLSVHLLLDDDMSLPTNVNHKIRSSRRYFPRIINIDGGKHLQSYTIGRGIRIDRHTLRAWKHIEDDKNYATDEQEETSSECMPMSSWYNYSYPNCNILHELDIPFNAYMDKYYYIASGGSNDVFRMKGVDNIKTDLVLKLLSPKKKHQVGLPSSGDYNEHNYHVVRKDAVISERLTNSQYVLPIHGYCGFAVIVPYANGGTLAAALATHRSQENTGWKNMSSTSRLKYARDAAKGLADAHDVGVVHADLTTKQYLVQNGTLQLGDFNQGILLQKNTSALDKNQTCTFKMTKNYGTTRAPEEYKHEPQTSAVDVWSLGSIIYHLLTGKKVWSEYSKNKAQESVIMGKLPKISKSIQNSTDPVDILLKKAMDMCYIYEPSQRATARKVATFLDNGWKEFGREKTS